MKSMFRWRILTLCILCLSGSSAWGNALNQFFESLGGQVNTSTPGSYHDQAAGYYTGGGYVMRQNNAVIQPINISLPQFGAGCNSLDMYFGSLSFLQTDKLVQLGRQVITGIPTYGLQLALKTMAPQIENLLAQLRKYVQDMNGLMLNSCQASQQIVGGIWPKGTTASEQICMDQTRSGNVDWFGARGHCDTPQAIDHKLNQAKAKYKDLLMGEYNLVWHVLQKMPAYQGTHKKDVAEFIMSITGTLISRKEGDRFRVRILEPRADHQEFLGVYLKGGTTSLLKCNDTHQCLAPQPIPITIQDGPVQQHATMKSKVIQRIHDLRMKYISKEAITDADIGFLNDTVNVPVYRYIQVSVAAGTPFLMQDAAEYIAVSVLLTQFDRVISEVLEAVDLLQKVQLDDAVIAEFKQNLQQTRARVQALLARANHGAITYLTQTIQAIEQSIIARNS